MFFHPATLLPSTRWLLRLGLLSVARLGLAVYTPGCLSAAVGRPLWETTPSSCGSSPQIWNWKLVHINYYPLYTCMYHCCSRACSTSPQGDSKLESRTLFPSSVCGENPWPVGSYQVFNGSASSQTWSPGQRRFLLQAPLESSPSPARCHPHGQQCLIQNIY